MKTQCYECGKNELTQKKVPYALHGIKLGEFTAEVCLHCDQQFFDEETSKKIELAARKAGVWGLCVQTRVGRSGNALDVRIAQQLAQFVGLAQGTDVTIHPDGRNRLIIEINKPTTPV